jgi:phosphoribosylformylglycinamidine synthase
MGGSHYHLVHGLSGGTVPVVDTMLAPTLFRRLHDAMSRGLVRACHDLSEGGLAVAAAEMAFAGGIGADLTKSGAAELPDHAALFAESPTRFLVEVRLDSAAEFEACLDGVPFTKVGQTLKEPRLRIAGSSGEWVVWAALKDLKDSWQKPLRW